MKNILKILICALVLSASYCEDEVPTVLPPETQTGANTLGFYMNGKLFVAHRNFVPWGHSYIGAEYVRDRRILGVNASVALGNLRIDVEEPEENIDMPMSWFRYRYNEMRYEEHNIGSVYLTKFDTVNHIVSGRFTVSLGDSINITDGRFDIKLQIPSQQ